MRPTAVAKEIRLTSTFASVSGTVMGDKDRLQQIVWNLLTNAIKFTPRGGRVHVIIQRVNSHVEICVTDTGEGIAPEFLSQVFDRFSQADASTTRRFGGLGVGLSIVRHLTELHGGSVRVTSEGLGLWLDLFDFSALADGALNQVPQAPERSLRRGRARCAKSTCTGPASSWWTTRMIPRRR